MLSLVSFYFIRWQIFINNIGWQAFFPVPFAQYNSEIAPEAKEDIEVKAAAGHFDIYRYKIKHTIPIYFDIKIRFLVLMKHVFIILIT